MTKPIKKLPTICLPNMGYPKLIQTQDGAILLAINNRRGILVGGSNLIGTFIGAGEVSGKVKDFNGSVSIRVRNSVKKELKMSTKKSTPKTTKVSKKSGAKATKIAQKSAKKK